MQRQRNRCREDMKGHRHTLARPWSSLLDTLAECSNRVLTKLGLEGDNGALLSWHGLKCSRKFIWLIPRVEFQFLLMSFSDSPKLESNPPKAVPLSLVTVDHRQPWGKLMVPVGQSVFSREWHFIAFTNKGTLERSEKCSEKKQN